jgi:class 3 adenylate cyclase
VAEALFNNPLVQLAYCLLARKILRSIPSGKSRSLAPGLGDSSQLSHKPARVGGEVVTMEPRWRHIVGRTMRIPPGEQRSAALAPRDGDPAPVRPAPSRLLAAVLAIDVVGSTAQAATLGDDRWLDLLVAYHAVARRQVGLHQGRVVGTAGDGIWAVFAMPLDAVRCATTTVERVDRLGIRLRAGVHAGVCEQVGDSVEGIVMHICARVTAKARPGETLVTGTVKDLLTGTPLAFQERDAHQLRGIEGSWPLFAVCGEVA